MLPCSPDHSGTHFCVSKCVFSSCLAKAAFCEWEQVYQWETMAHKDLMIHLEPCQGLLFLSVCFCLSWRLHSEPAVFLLCCSVKGVSAWGYWELGWAHFAKNFCFYAFPILQKLRYETRPRETWNMKASEEFPNHMNTWIFFPTVTKWRSRLQPICVFTFPLPLLWREQIFKSLQSTSTKAFEHTVLQCHCDTHTWWSSLVPWAVWRHISSFLLCRNTSPAF